MLLKASGAVGEANLRPSPTAVLKLRGGGLVPLQKLGTALRPVANNLAAGWHGWCTLTAPAFAAGTVIALVPLQKLGIAKAGNQSARKCYYLRPVKDCQSQFLKNGWANTYF